MPAFVYNTTRMFPRGGNDWIKRLGEPVENEKRMGVPFWISRRESAALATETTEDWFGLSIPS